MLDNVYSSLKATFEARRAAMLGTGPIPRYSPPADLKLENVAKVIQTTNNRMGTAAADNNREQILATSRKSNLLMALSRDNHSATAPRLIQVNNYLNYIERALFEANPEDENSSDGMLRANIGRVEL